MMKTFFVWPPKKGLHVIFLQTLGANVWSQTMLGTIFAPIGFSREFAEIFMGFAQIFNKSKLCVCAFTPAPPPPSPAGLQLDI